MDKVAVVTGGTRGIGKNIVIDLVHKGYRVIVNYSKSDEAAAELLNELPEYKDKIRLLKADLSHKDSLQYFLDRIDEYTGTIDVLILNCGATSRDELKNVSFETWEHVMNVNLNIPFFIVQKLENKINNKGRIIFISSVLGVKPDSLSIQYGVSKAAIISLTQYLVKYFIGRSITVNSVSPGFVDTEWQKSKPEDIRNRIINKIPAKRFASTQEISDTCMFLINNGYITGQNIIVDGGYST